MNNPKQTKPSETTETAAAAILSALSGMVQYHSPEETAEALVTLIRDNEASHNDKARFVMCLLIVASEAASAFAADATEGARSADEHEDEALENDLIKTSEVLRLASASANLSANEVFNLSDIAPHTTR